MAITIIDEPMPFWPICNNVEWTFESDNTGQANFSFIVEVYINGALNSTHQVFPENGDAGKFNISALGRAVLNNNYPDQATFGQELLTEYVWSLLIYERYGTPAEVIIASSEATSGFIFLNGSFRYANATTGGWDYRDYDLDTGGKGDLFLTDFPRNKKDLVSYSEAKYLSIINSGGDNCTGYVNLYNISGTLIASATWTGALATGLIIPLVSVGPSVLVGGTSLVQADFDNCYYYTIQLKQTSDATKDSEIYRIYYDQSCSAYSRRRLIWLNKYGAWDSFTFTLLSEDSSDVTSNRYSKRTGRWVGSSYEYDLSDGHQMTVSKSVQDKLILNSDWIHEEVQQWLVRDLYESPRVYLQNDFGSSIFEPVNVTNANYLLKQRRKAGLIQEQVQIDRTYTYISQLG
jgi:hypothetical protein